MSLYRTVLAEGQHDDLCAYLHHELLRAQWPVMRILVSRAIREVWEARFPQLHPPASEISPHRDGEQGACDRR
ncbi:hypothetical protein ACFV9P_31725 [Streptomyces sp. NPDC059892]|uniref:hypothetical protein n=1 Tax=Streptomyces sp. NPDC059892 TaxID=3346989 RepID=UPI003668B508